MLETLFVISTVLLGAVFTVRMREQKAGYRYGHLLRVALDRKTQRVTMAIRDGWTNSLHFIERNVLLKGLHMVTYLALVFVRYMERKLVHVSQQLRSFRKDHHVLRRSTHMLAQHHTSTDVHENPDRAESR